MSQERKHAVLPEWAKPWQELMDKEALEELKDMSEMLFELARGDEFKAMTGTQALTTVAVGLRATAEIGLQAAPPGSFWEEAGKLLAKAQSLNGGEPVLPNPGGKIL
jgi:hypothetical protein